MCYSAVVHSYNDQPTARPQNVQTVVMLCSRSPCRASAGPEMTAGPAPPGGACPSLWTPSTAEALLTDDATRKGFCYNAGAVVVFKATCVLRGAREACMRWQTEAGEVT